MTEDERKRFEQVILKVLEERPEPPGRNRRRVNALDEKSTAPPPTTTKIPMTGRRSSPMNEQDWKSLCWHLASAYEASQRWLSEGKSTKTENREFSETERFHLLGIARVVEGLKRHEDARRRAQDQSPCLPEQSPWAHGPGRAVINGESFRELLRERIVQYFEDVGKAPPEPLGGNWRRLNRYGEVLPFPNNDERKRRRPKPRRCTKPPRRGGDGDTEG